jgi:hypothetical protein
LSRKEGRRSGISKRLGGKMRKGRETHLVRLLLGRNRRTRRGGLFNGLRLGFGCLGLVIVLLLSLMGVRVLKLERREVSSARKEENQSNRTERDERRESESENGHGSVRLPRSGWRSRDLAIEEEERGRRLIRKEEEEDDLEEATKTYPLLDRLSRLLLLGLLLRRSLVLVAVGLLDRRSIVSLGGLALVPVVLAVVSPGGRSRRLVVSGGEDLGVL